MEAKTTATQREAQPIGVSQMQSCYTTSLVDPEHVIFIFRENGQEIKVKINPASGITTASKTLRENEINHLYDYYITRNRNYKNTAN